MNLKSSAASTPATIYCSRYEREQLYHLRATEFCCNADEVWPKAVSGLHQVEERRHIEFPRCPLLHRIADAVREASRSTPAGKRFRIRENRVEIVDRRWRSPSGSQVVALIEEVTGAAQVIETIRCSSSDWEGLEKILDSQETAFFSCSSKGVWRSKRVGRVPIENRTLLDNPLLETISRKLMTMNETRHGGKFAIRKNGAVYGMKTGELIAIVVITESLQEPICRKVQSPDGIGTSR